jgi:hypothetical protein
VITRDQRELAQACRYPYRWRPLAGVTLRWPTPTMALRPGSPAGDVGNPAGCTDGHDQLLSTDQRGAPRPDLEDSGGCDIGARELRAARPGR